MGTELIRHPEYINTHKISVYSQKQTNKQTNKQVMKLIAGIFFTLLLIVTSEAQNCTPIQGCDLKINGSCYAHVDDSLNWNQAEDCCIAWGGHLASIHSNDTNTILNSIRNQNRWTWIGLSDTANDSVYVWTDGTQYDYENFSPGEPNSKNGESCFLFWDGFPTWNDYYCTSSTYGSILTSYICQKSELILYDQTQIHSYT